MNNTVHYNIKLKVLTPVHIADVEYKSKIKKNEFILDRKSQVLQIIDTNKFIEVIKREGKLDAYIDYIEQTVGQQQRNEINIYNFLREHRLLNRVNEFSRKKFQGIPYEKLNDLTLHVTNSKGNIYFPGSSLKGAIIQALLVDYIISNSDEFDKERTELIREAERMDYKQFKNYAKSLIQSIESRILYGTEKKQHLTNGLFISDTFASENLATNVYQDIDEKLGKPEKEMTAIPNFREYVEVDSVFYFKLSIDLLAIERGKLKIRSLEDLIQSIENASIFLFDQTLRVKAEPALIIGANTGYHQKSIIHALISDSNARLKVVRKLINSVDSIRKPRDTIRFHLNDKYFSPRVINKSDCDYMMSGHVKLSKGSEFHA